MFLHVMLLVAVQGVLGVGDPCVICLDELETSSNDMEAAKGPDHLTLPCKHRFHSDCIRAWQQRGTRNCPLCRQSLADATTETAGAGDLRSPLIVSLDHPFRALDSPHTPMYIDLGDGHVYGLRCHFMFATIAFARLISDVLSHRCIRYPGVVVFADVYTIVGLIVAAVQLKEQFYIQFRAGRSYLGVYLQAATLQSLLYVVTRSVLIQAKYVGRSWFAMRFPATRVCE